MIRSGSAAFLRMNSRSGMTLVEVMIAMLLLVIFIAPAISGLVIAESETSRSHDAIAATSIASRTLEDIKDFASIQFSKLGVDDSTIADDQSALYDVDLTDFPSQEGLDPRYTVNAKVRIWARDPESGAIMLGVKEIIVQVSRTGDSSRTPLAEVRQWITLGGP